MPCIGKSGPSFLIIMTKQGLLRFSQIKLKLYPGTGVVRPLSFEFVNDKTTHAIDEQFMWGSGLLFSPVLYQGYTSVEAYFPDARWWALLSDVSVCAVGFAHKSVWCVVNDHGVEPGSQGCLVGSQRLRPVKNSCNPQTFAFSYTYALGSQVVCTRCSEPNLT